MSTPTARSPGLVQPADVISAIDNEVIQSSEQAVKILNQTGRSRPVGHQSRPAGQWRDGTANGPGAVMNPLTSALADARRRQRPVNRGEPLRRSRRCSTARRPMTVAAAFLTALRIEGRDRRRARGGRRRGPRTHDPLGKRDGSGFPLLDTCGTGGDGAGTVNISTAAAIVVAACGVPVVKHGNRAATGRSGSSDVLAALGVATDLEPALSRRCLAELKIAFLFAPRFHPGLARVAPVRRQLPFRTIFNLVGPLCNPACPSRQLVGVPNEIQAELVAQVLSGRRIFAAPPS